MKLNRLLLVALMSLGGLAAAEGKSAEVQPKKAFFKVKNVFTVNVPKDAKTVRIWFAVPQEDAQSSVRNLTVSTDGAVRYETAPSVFTVRLRTLDCASSCEHR